MITLHDYGPIFGHSVVEERQAEVVRYEYVVSL